MRTTITFLILFSIQLCPGVGVGESNTGPLKAEVEPALLKFVLAQNYPNPFNPSTVIAYSITTSSNVLIEVYSLLGKRITTLVNKYQNAGSYSVNFDAGGLSNGIYYYKLQAGSFTDTKKMLLLK